MNQRLQIMWATIALAGILTLGYLGYGLVQSNNAIVDSNNRIAEETNKISFEEKRQSEAAIQQCIDAYLVAHDYSNISGAVTQILVMSNARDACRPPARSP